MSEAPKFVQLVATGAHGVFSVFGLDDRGVVWLYRPREDADNAEWNNGCEWRPLVNWSNKPDHVATRRRP